MLKIPERNLLNCILKKLYKFAKSKEKCSRNITEILTWLPVDCEPSDGENSLLRF